MDTPAAGFKMGRLDHVHVRVPNRAEAAAWYAEHLGFQPVERFDFWATGFEGGPLQISADGGTTTLALFEATDDHPMDPQRGGIAFSVSAPRFVSFARSLPGDIAHTSGARLDREHLIDFDLCWAFEFCDPWGNVYELNSYDYDAVGDQLVGSDGVEPTRYWPSELHEHYLASHDRTDAADTIEVSERTPIGAEIDTSSESNGCFACSHHNPNGLGIRTRRTTPTGVEARWTPPRHYQGAPGVVHGGIQATVLDDAMGLLVSDVLADPRYGVTTDLAVKFRRPAVVDRELVVTADIVGRSGDDVHLTAELRTTDGDILATATATYRLLHPLGDIFDDA